MLTATVFQTLKKSSEDKPVPFKSKAQMRWMFAAEARGELPKGTAKRWAEHTKNIKKLPERKKPKKQEDSKKSAKLAALYLRAKIASLRAKLAAKAPVPGPQPGGGNIPVQWPLTVTAPAAKGGKFILSADFFGPNLLDKRLGKGPGTLTTTNRGTVRQHHPMKIASLLTYLLTQLPYARKTR